MKKKKLLSLTIAVLSAFSSMMISCKKSSSVEEMSNMMGKSKSVKTLSIGHPAGLQTNLRMFGYFGIFGGSWASQVDSVNMNQLTDVGFSFVNPDSTGVFTISSDLAQAVVKVHSLDVRAYFSMGGGGGPAYWDNLIKPANRAQVISNIRKVATTYNFEGVDVDFEGPRITSDYNDFMVQLSDTLKQYSKLLSCALASYQRNQLSAAVYSRLDYINVMCYDYTYSTPQSHSSFAQFQTDFNAIKALIPVAKINMGVPGYAWEYDGNTPTTQVSYKSIWQQNPKAGFLNYMYPTPTKSWWYDGFPVLRQKVAYCLQQGAGGMMMWQIMHDPKDTTASLLRLMNFCAGNPTLAGFNPNISYLFRNDYSNKYMDVAGASTANGANMQQETYNSLAASQRWITTSLGSGQFKFINANSGLALEAYGSSTANGVNIDQWAWWGGNNQKFTLNPDAYGYYEITNVNSGNAVETYGESTADGLNIDVWAWWAGPNQKWIIER
jgi:GH18 family chitinase